MPHAGLEQENDPLALCVATHTWSPVMPHQSTLNLLQQWHQKAQGHDFEGHLV